LRPGDRAERSNRRSDGGLWGATVTPDEIVGYVEEGLEGTLVVVASEANGAPEVAWGDLRGQRRSSETHRLERARYEKRNR
jgi:hypothetical protein